jgi:hypothetical protein
MSSTNIDKGYIYVLYNPMYVTYGECYKIGQTLNIKSRLNNYSTYYPEDCEIKYCSKQILHYKEIEKAVHKLLNDNRISSNREFFKCSLNDIIKLIEEVCKYTKEYLLTILEDNEQVENNKISIKTYVKTKDEIYSCEFCKASFDLKYNFERHIKTSKKCLEIREKIPKVKCVWCNELIINTHINNHYNICSVNKEFSYMSLLEKYNMLNEIHNKQIEEKDKQIKELQQQIFELQNDTKHNTISLLCSKPLSLEKERVKAIIERNLPNVEGKYLAEWFLDNVCKNEEGKVSIQCTDKKRKTFKYIDKEDKLQTLKREDLEELLNSLGLKIDKSFVNKLVNLTYK